MGLDDRFADGKADAHVAALVGDGLLVAGEVAVEQVREQGGGDPLPVVGDLEDGEIFAARQAQGDLRGGLAVLDGVSMRLMRTCSIRMMSMGIIRRVSGAEISTRVAG